MGRVSGATAEALERGRERYNAAFAALRKAGTPVDDEAFMQHLAQCIAPIVDAVAADFPERAGGVLDALFTVSLELFNGSLLGPSAKTPAVAGMWDALLKQIPKLIVRDPRRVAASLSNAIYNIACTPGARPDSWIAQMRLAAPLCSGVQDLFECGKIAAWRAGMPHYRTGAINAATTLAPPLAATMLELPANTPADRLAKSIERLRADPWSAATDPQGEATLKHTARVGAFRALGGEFLRPPKVWCSAKNLYVSDGEATWQLVSDRYGCLFIRIDSEPAPDPASADVRALTDGSIAWGNDRLREPSLTSVSSCACDGQTFAAASNYSHHVFLFAKTTGNPRGGVDAA